MSTLPTPPAGATHKPPPVASLLLIASAILAGLPEPRDVDIRNRADGGRLYVELFTGADLDLWTAHLDIDPGGIVRRPYEDKGTPSTIISEWGPVVRRRRQPLRAPAGDRTDQCRGRAVNRLWKLLARLLRPAPGVPSGMVTEEEALKSLTTAYELGRQAARLADAPPASSTPATPDAPADLDRSPCTPWCCYKDPRVCGGNCLNDGIDTPATLSRFELCDNGYVIPRVSVHAASTSGFKAVLLCTPPPCPASTMSPEAVAARGPWTSAGEEGISGRSSPLRLSDAILGGTDRAGQPRVEQQPDHPRRGEAEQH